MNLAVILYESLNLRRPLTFSLSSALFCLFLHDFDKVQRYELTADGALRSRGAYSKDYLAKTRSITDAYGYTLTDEEYNALKYAHGEGDDYHPTERIIMPLGTLVHCCDIISARIWYDNGKNHSSWDE